MCRKLIYLIAFVLLFGLAANVNAQVGKGNILFEYYTGTTSELSTLLSLATYPDHPDSSEWRTSFEGQTDWSDNYGTRVRGYLYPPQTGDYTFWIASDDQSQLWLSTDDTPEKAVQIANVDGWTPSRDFDNTGGGVGGPSQKSNPIRLEAGKTYYIMALQAEGGGGDNLAVAWQGPGVPTRTVIAGSYLSPVIRQVDLIAFNPNPADGAVGVPVPLLQWEAGKTAKWHDVYFGTNPTPGPAEYVGRQPFAVYWHAPGLAVGTTYYWRVDEVEADGTTIHTGNVWSFTSVPLIACKPVPANGAKGLPTDVDLSWTAGVGAVTHDVYFGNNQADVAAGTGGTFKGNKPLATYDPGDLTKGVTYYWRIDEHDAAGKVYTGEVWRFTTISPNAGVRVEFFNGMQLSGAPIYRRVDPEINWYWNSGVKPYPELPSEDNFSVRCTAALEPQVTDFYTFITGSDDGVRLFLNGQMIIDDWTDHDRTEDRSTPVQLVAGQSYLIVLEGYENGGEAEWQLYWQSPSIARQVIPVTVLSLPVSARSPNPANGATGVAQTVTLSWAAGETADKHDVYFGTDEAAVFGATTATAGVYRGRQAKDATSYTPTEVPLQWGKTYYWRIDEVEADGTTINTGGIWSFTVANYLVVDNFESYDDVTTRIFDIWADYAVNNTGATVGYFDPPFAELTIVHGGKQAMPMRYDNDGTVNEGTQYEKTGTRLYSEVEREWTAPQDWTVNGVDTLKLYFQGAATRFAESAGTITMSAAGTDIWGTADEFRYAYKQLNGDGQIVAKVVSIGGPGNNEWRKAGVMIREGLDASSRHAFMAITPAVAHGVAFQNRPTANGSSVNASQNVGFTTPAWVKLVRQGAQFTGYYSTNGTNWIQVPASTASDGSPNPQTIAMSPNAYVGLALTSHQSGVLCVAQFSDVTITGATGAWTIADIGVAQPGNDAQPVYVVLQDSANKTAVVKHSDPAATLLAAWTEWSIRLADFTGLNLRAIKKISIGVGDRANPQRGGAGRLFIDDIGLYLPAPPQ